MFKWLKDFFQKKVLGLPDVAKAPPEPEPPSSPFDPRAYEQPEAVEREQAYRQGNREKFMGEDETSFVWFGGFVDTPNSSNVASLQYDYESQKLTVGYKGRRESSLVGYYEYSFVNEEQARDLLFWVTKGGWVWDNLRVRGTKCGTQKPYVFLSAPSSWHPNPGCGGNDQLLFPFAGLRNRKPKKRKFP